MTAKSETNHARNAYADPADWIGEEWAELADALRARDDDPAYAAAPVLDAYARISRNPVTGEMEKTDRQLGDILESIERRHARLGLILRDDNVSAWKLNAKRPGWKTLMARIQSRETNGAHAWHTDRLMRQPRDLEALIDAAGAGAIVASCWGDYDLGSADDRFILRIQTAAACKSSDDTARRQKRKFAAMRKAGKYGGCTRPFGFPGNDPVTKKPVSDEQVAAEREALAWGTARFLEGKTNKAAIAAEWNRRGLRTTLGREFVSNSVRELLPRARNAGLIEEDGVVVGRAADVAPIVSEAELMQVRAKLAAAKRGRPANPFNLCTAGVLRCGVCGNTTGSGPCTKPYADGTQRRRYCCRDACTTVDQRTADRYVKEMTIARLSDPRHAMQVAARSAAVGKLDAQLAEVDKTAREIGARLGAGRLDLDRYDAIMAPLDERRAALAAERDALLAEGATANAPATPATVADLERAWGDDDDTDPAVVEHRRALVWRAFPHGLILNKRKRPGPHAWEDDRITPAPAPVTRALAA